MDAERRVHRRMPLTPETRVVEKPGEEKEQCPLIGVIRGAGNIGRRWGARLGWPDPGHLSIGCDHFDILLSLLTTSAPDLSGLSLRN
jgi:hypothetical protein